MSYDVSIGRENYNYTYNVSKLFYDHILDVGAGGGINELDGKTGKQCVSILADSIRRMDDTRINLWQADEVGEPHFCAKYDSPNGWGSALGGIVFLSRILSECALNPRAKVRVY